MTQQRIQLALNVRDIDEAVDYYTKLFGVKVNKRKPGYANFAIDEPPLKLVLFENENTGRLNYLGVEVLDQKDMAAVTDRLVKAGIADEQETDSTCCYATQDKIWSSDPQGMPWEWYTVLEDSGTFFAEDAKEQRKEMVAEGSCC